MRRAQEIPTSDRYLVEERLGEGGMGVVYRALDRSRGTAVALKTLLHVSPAALVRFKDEFRAVADVAHPNVVELFDLVALPDGTCFFTMELVTGVSFQDWVTGSGRAPVSGAFPKPVLVAEDDATLDAASLAPGTTSRPPPEVRIGGPRARDHARLRDAFHQLASGVAAIHAVGKVHRDIKPSNVLVTPEGRVVLLDFGLARDVDRGLEDRDEHVSGTPAYMAPEQAGAGLSTPAADAYALGVVLFEVLTGRLPHEGTPMQMLYGKTQAEAPPVDQLVDDAPDDLVALAAALLRRDPRERPTVDDVCRLLASRTSLAPRSSGAFRVRTFVGRSTELGTLREAWDASIAGDATLVLVSGDSGVGKSAIVEHFADEAARRGALVLAGRCYERENVPYKALDAVVDALAAKTERLSPEDLRHILPPGMRELARVFPVFGAGAWGTVDDALEPVELRRRAVGALRELLTAFARVRSVVVRIDDLQWGDEDSGLLLGDLVAGPDAPPVLWVATHRTGEPGPMLSALFDGDRARRLAGVVRRLELAPLDDVASKELVSRLGGPELARRPELATSIARASHGSPLLLSELVRHEEARLARGEGGERLGQTSLEDALLARMSTLPDDARGVLEVLSVAARPLERSLVLRAAGLPDEASALRTLTVSRLVASRGTGSASFVEPYHDKIREALADTLPEAHTRRIHATLARELLARGDADPEHVMGHHLGAGDRRSARQFAVLAAEQATRGLAFRRAAELYRTALALGADDPSRSLRRKLADSLANAGLGADAAVEYLGAATEAQAERSAELKRLAAEHFLKTGHDEEGIRTLREVLTEVGLPFPGSPRAALFSVVVQKAKLFFQRGDLDVLAREDRPLDRAPKIRDARAEARCDVAYSAAVGLSLQDAIRTADFSARHLTLALSLGDPVRICRAIALEASMTAAEGVGAREKARRLVGISESLAYRIGDTRAIAFAKLTAAYVSVFLGEFADGCRRMTEVRAHLRDQCSGVAWEIANAEMWMANTLILTGALREASRAIPAVLESALDRGDRYTMQHIIYPVTIERIVAADLPGAVARREQLVGEWTLDRYTSGHWGALVSAISIDRWEGRGRDALAKIEREWSALERHYLLRVQMVRVCALYERALSALAAHRETGESRFLGEARSLARKMAREDAPYAKALADKVLGLAIAADDPTRAAEVLGRASDALRAVELHYLATAAAHRRGILLGGDEGRRLVDGARRALAAESVVDPDRTVAMSAPLPARWA